MEWFHSIRSLLSSLIHLHSPLLPRPPPSQVGLGLKPKICRSTCTAWLSACRNDYFGFDSISGALVPCTASAVASRLLVCSRLKELAPEGAEQLCNMEGERNLSQLQSYSFAITLWPQAPYHFCLLCCRYGGV